MKDCCKKLKHREEKEKKELIHRLNRVEGQVRGIRKMVEEDCYCVDVLTQVAAIQAALNGFNKVLLGQHIRTCVVEEIRNGDEEVIEELLETIKKIMK